MNTASRTQPDEAELLAQPMRTLGDLVEDAMRLARIAVEEYEALVHPRAEADAIPTRRQPDPGMRFIRLANFVQACIFGQHRNPRARSVRSHTSAPEDHAPIVAAKATRVEPHPAARVRPPLPTVSSNHPQERQDVDSSLEPPGDARAGNTPDSFRGVLGQTVVPPARRPGFMPSARSSEAGWASARQIHIARPPQYARSAAQERKIACGIRAAPA